ncbi:MAG: hypothetical protein ACOYB3_05010 [Azonexus sp.]
MVGWFQVILEKFKFFLRRQPQIEGDACGGIAIHDLYYADIRDVGPRNEKPLVSAREEHALFIGQQMNMSITGSPGGRKIEKGGNKKAGQRPKLDWHVAPVLDGNKRCRDAGDPGKSAQQMHEPPGQAIDEVFPFKRWHFMMDLIHAGLCWVNGEAVKKWVLRVADRSRFGCSFKLADSWLLPA